MVSDYNDWIMKFDVNEYIDKPYHIKKLNESLQLEIIKRLELEEKVSKFTEKIHDLEKENISIHNELSYKKQLSIFSFAFSFIVVILVGFGINIITNKPYSWTGWLMIGAAIIIEIVLLMMNFFKLNLIYKKTRN